jgi:16S rRNA (cytidine1402-2'-O)-methyltransferase
LVFYEAPHRLLEMLKDAREILGEREIVIAREVTKVHEEFVRGTIGTALEYLKRRPVKGEITVLIGLHAVSDANTGAPQSASIISETQAVMAGRKVDERAALKIVARARGVSKSEAYRLLQAEKNRKS